MSFRNTWSKTGSSEKAQSSQTIRILLKSLQYLAEDSTLNMDTANKFVNCPCGVTYISGYTHCPKCGVANPMDSKTSN